MKATRASAGLALPAVAVAALFVLPVAWMAAASFKAEADIHRDVDSLRSFVPQPVTCENYIAAVGRSRLATTTVNTLIVVVAIAGLGVLVNGAAAFAFARMRFRGRDLLFALVVASLILPLEVIVIPLFMTVRSTSHAIEIVGERPWTLAMLSLPFVAKAFNIFVMRQHFLALPRALEEAAFLDGAGWRGVFFRVALPNVKPAIVTVVLLDFVVHWNDFLWPLVVSQGEDSRTVQLGLGNFFTQPPISWGAIMAYAALITIPIALVFSVGQRWMSTSAATAGLKG